MKQILSILVLIGSVCGALAQPYLARYETLQHLLNAGKPATRAPGTWITEGRTAKNDGYGNVYYWDPLSSASTNSTVLKPTGWTGDGRWIALIQVAGPAGPTGPSGTNGQSSITYGFLEFSGLTDYTLTNGMGNVVFSTNTFQTGMLTNGTYLVQATTQFDALSQEQGGYIQLFNTELAAAVLGSLKGQWCLSNSQMNIVTESVATITNSGRVTVQGSNWNFSQAAGKLECIRSTIRWLKLQ
jgi:hypothetical protein